MNDRVVIVTTVPMSLQWLLRGQPKYLSQYFDVSLVASPGPEIAEIEATEGVTVHPIAMTRTISPLADLASLAKLTRHFRRRRPALVHAYTPKAGTLAMQAAAAARVPTRIYSVVGLPLMETSGMKRRLLVGVERLTYRFATEVYANSNGLRTYIAANISSRQSVGMIGAGSANGIDTARFANTYTADGRAEIRRSLGLRAGDFVFVFVGRLVREKGIGELVTAFRSLAACEPSARLLLVGGQEEDLDPLPPATLAAVETDESIITTGTVPDLLPYLAASDALVLPTYREGLPATLLEAASFGLPMIATDVVGCNEVITHGETGLLVPRRDAERLAGAMAALMADGPLRARLAARAKVDVADRYGQEKFHREVAATYGALISSRQ